MNEGKEESSENFSNDCKLTCGFQYMQLREI